MSLVNSLEIVGATVGFVTGINIVIVAMGVVSPVVEGGFAVVVESLLAIVDLGTVTPLL